MGIFDLFKNMKTTNDTLIKGKNPKAFDYKKEKELLSEYNKYKDYKDKSFVYFSALPMIDFYYKFRNLDSRYLGECIKYCEICISLLTSPYMKNDLKAGMYIPAFKRLFIIYKNNGEYQKAMNVIKQAKKYNQDAEYFEKQKNILEEKMKN